MGGLPDFIDLAAIVDGDPLKLTMDGADLSTMANHQKFGTAEAKGSAGLDPAKWIHSIGTDIWADTQNGIIYSQRSPVRYRPTTCLLWTQTRAKSKGWRGKDMIWGMLIDGLDLTLADASSLRRQIGVVLQENVLFNPCLSG